MMRKIALAVAGVLLLGGCSQLTAFNTLTPKDPATRLATDVVFDPQTGLSLDIYAPRGAAAATPVVVFFYGGSWDSGRKEDYAFLGRAIASRGFVTVLPDYRLVPDVAYPAFVQDSARAVKWVEDNIGQYGGDGQVIFLAGHSAGAYNAVQAVLNPEFFTEAGVDEEAVRGVASISGPFDFLPLDVPASINAFGTYDDLPDILPVNHARADAPPLLLLHGSDDETVGLFNAQNLKAALDEAGAAVDLKVYEGVNHIGIMLALSRPFRGRASTLEDMTDFFARLTPDGK